MTPPEAKKLQDEGYTLLDVRSEEEFAQGHAAGALNVPYLNKGAYGMIPNEDFSRVMSGLFADRGTGVVTMCQMGGRSSRAAAELERLGFTKVVDMRGGFGGEKDERGQIALAGWKDAGLPVENETPDRNYRSLRVKAGLSTTPPPAPARAPSQSHGHGHSHGAPAAPTGPSRFEHPSERVMCQKLKQELPALKRVPMGGDLGVRIKQSISARAWEQWVEHSKLLINEYRLNPADPKSQATLLQQCEQFLFGEGVEKPKEFVEKK